MLNPGKTDMHHKVSMLNRQKLSELVDRMLKKGGWRMYDVWFVWLSRHRLQICRNGSTTTATSGLVRGEAVIHGCGTSSVVNMCLLLFMT